MTPVVKYTVMHACGHEATHVHSGNDTACAREAARLANQPCSACRRLQRRETALALLSGNPDEVAWAETIRDSVLARNREYLRTLLAEVTSQDEAAMRGMIERAGVAAIAILEQQRDAVWWLEHRFDALDFVKMHVAAALAAASKPQST